MERQDELGEHLTRGQSKLRFNVRMRQKGKLNQDTSEEFTQVRFGFVQGSFPIFVTNADLSPVSHKILREKKKSERCNDI